MTIRCERNSSAGIVPRVGSGVVTGLLDAGYAAAAIPLLAAAVVRGKGATVFDHLRRRVFQAVPERTGGLPCFWIHGVSVGEVLAARPLVASFETHLPGWTIVVSSSTRAGLDSARRHFSEHLVLSCPLDLSWLMRRAFRRLRPDAVVIVEHDLWPNWLRQAARRGVPVALVNARVSERSLRGYRRLARLSRWLERNLALVCAQDEASAAGFRQLGFSDEKVNVTGNLKFDSPPPSVSGVRDEMGFHENDWVFVAGSTHEGEEETVLEAFSRVRKRTPASYLVLVPRRTERTAEVAKGIRQRGFTFSLWSEGKGLRGDVLLVDTVGDLAKITAAGDLVFVGGSLVPVGGHNVIEPASLGKPVLIGPHYQNQKSLVPSFLERDALLVVRDGNELAEKTLELEGNRRAAAELGERARLTVEVNVGAGKRTVEALKEMVERHAKGTP